MNIRDQLLAKLTRPADPVTVDGITVYVRDVSYDAMLRLSDMRLDDSSNLTPRKIAEYQKLLVLDCVCDEQGNPLLTDADWDAVSRSNGKLLKELFEIVNKRNAEKTAEAGNESGAAGSAENASSSPSPSESGPATSTSEQ